MNPLSLFICLWFVFYRGLLIFVSVFGCFKAILSGILSPCPLPLLFYQPHQTCSPEPALTRTRELHESQLQTQLLSRACPKAGVHTVLPSFQAHSNELIDCCHCFSQASFSPSHAQQDPPSSAFRQRPCFHPPTI